MLLAAITHCMVAQDLCGTMPHVHFIFAHRLQAQLQFQQGVPEFNKAMTDVFYHKGTNGLPLYRVPVVFHIVLKHPAAAQLTAQLDTLNNNFAGTKTAGRLAGWIQAIAGHSVIQFCLAATDPMGQATTGIERRTTQENSFTIDDRVKHTVSGGSPAWYTERYFNIWVSDLSDNLPGYASFPDDGHPDEQGVVVDYRTLPGGSYTRYSSVNTLTHQTGHYSNLYHNYGDDPAGSGSDHSGGKVN
ncbi:MAG: M43 family zinc metalloprotease [Bacteroidota bacterium]